MELQVNLSKNIILHYLEENVVDDNSQIVSIQYNFSFYGEYCVAVISKDNIQSSFGSVVFAEAPSELHDSFMEAIEETHWEKLKTYWLEFEKEYNSVNELEKED